MACGHRVEGAAIIAGDEAGHHGGADLTVRLVAFSVASGFVHLAIHTAANDYLLYLDEKEAMRLSKALRALAIEALEADC